MFVCTILTIHTMVLKSWAQEQFVAATTAIECVVVAYRRTGSSPWFDCIYTKQCFLLFDLEFDVAAFASIDENFGAAFISTSAIYIEQFVSVEKSR